MRNFLIALLLLITVLGAAGYAALKYATSIPGKSHEGPLPPLTADERAIAATLKRHIEAIAAREHNVAHYDELEKVAVYLEGVLSSLGYAIGRQEYVVDGKAVRNLDAVIEAQSATDPEVIVVGAHYDSAPDTPGANDNASGTASVLELARLLADLKGKTNKRIRLVLFVNEEPPYFWAGHMGSVHYARMLAERKERVTGNAWILLGRARQPAVPAAVRPHVSQPRQLRLVRRPDQLATAGTAEHRVIPVTHVVSDRRRRRAVAYPWHRVVGSLVILAIRLPGRDDHRHRDVPVSALP
jgi:hypothetical protein